MKVLALGRRTRLGRDGVLVRALSLMPRGYWGLGGELEMDSG